MPPVLEMYVRAWADAPDDEGRRLALADHLDELGDPRGAVLRTAGTFRHCPPLDDPGPLPYLMWDVWGATRAIARFPLDGVRLTGYSEKYALMTTFDDKDWSVVMPNPGQAVPS